ncbi:hypothetical protein NM208_g2813 [Fusarium decemcellulare]|uniref:Uncharacterized protein n=1 Tax=Fusarium decemcellulare TaxID=57161 RepID=A0ACC1SRG6_9HYPO|nr:hypothetical protein NM208_g2813 [Fusarium decemcellulare]
MSNLPDYHVARRLVLTYFRIWHPLVPFLQGPECLEELRSLYDQNPDGTRRKTPSLSRLVTFRCIFNIGRLESDESLDLGSATIRSASDLIPILSLLALRSDGASIQALLSAQLYFIATMSLRHASSIGGLIIKSIVQTGMHRCPFRYWHLSPDERSMRKRIFWSFYVLDRFLSQSLGHPNGIQDSDIDVCVPGHRDLHDPVANSALSPSSAAPDSIIQHLPTNHPGRDRGSVSQHRHSQGRDLSEEEEDGNNYMPNRHGASASPSLRSTAILQHRRETQAVLGHHVQYSQLIGRLLEVFHKSVHVRDADDQTVLLLKADVAAWGNSLTKPRVANSTLLESTELTPDPNIFPFISYHYAILLTNRPFLSLEPSSAEFRAAIQTCISAANSIIETMERYSELGGPLFWPGYMSAIWMSGLILALAARIESYSAARAKTGISCSLKLLTIMTRRWPMARACREVLSMLLKNIEPKRKRVAQNTDSRPNAQNGTDFPRPSKRRITNGHLETPTNNGHVLSRESPLMSVNFADASRNALSPRISFNETQAQNDYHFPTDPSRSLQNLQSEHGFNFTSSLDPTNQHSVPPLGPYHAPIPTIFPDGHPSSCQNMDLLEGADSFLDIFDGATWGHFINMIDDSGSTM